MLSSDGCSALRCLKTTPSDCLAATSLVTGVTNTFIFTVCSKAFNVGRTSWLVKDCPFWATTQWRILQSTKKFGTLVWKLPTEYFVTSTQLPLKKSEYFQLPPSKVCNRGGLFNDGSSLLENQSETLAGVSPIGTHWEYRCLSVRQQCRNMWCPTFHPPPHWTTTISQTLFPKVFPPRPVGSSQKPTRRFRMLCYLNLTQPYGKTS